jgi:hypothetical protein
MSQRVNIGDDGEWIDVSNAAVNEISAHAIDQGLAFDEALADLLTQ